jgi:hypothetical protein
MRIDSSGNIGIGQTPYSYSRLSTEGSDNTSSNYAFIAYNENTDAILACRNDGQVTMPTGNVGIGTTSPAEKLHIRDASTDANVYIKIANDSRDWFMGVEGSNSDILSFKTHDASNLLNITSGGNVGIGETSPTQLLHIKATSAGNNGITLQSTNVSGNSQVRFLNTSGIERAAITYVNSVDAVYHYTTGGGNLLNLVGANIGIGTANPRVQNEIYGTGQLTSAISDSGYTGGTLSLSSNQNAFNAGGCLLFGAVNDSGNTKPQASIKSLLQNGVLQGVGDLAFSTRASTSDTALTERMRITSVGEVKIGTTTVSSNGLTIEKTGNHIFLRNSSNTTAGQRWNFDVTSANRLYIINQANTGVTMASGDTAWSAQSDEILKENIKPLENVLDKIKDYRCVEYNLKSDKTKVKKIGFIAQDWENDFAPIINKDDEGLLGMKYTETIPVLLKAIQELKAEIELLKTQINN